MHILLVEPDTILAQMYIEAFDRAGHNVSYVSTAEAAIHVADRKKPDVVVLEIQLTGHSGVAFMHEFRSYADWLHTPVILHTLVSPARLQSFEGALQEMGIAARLYKPQTSLRQLVTAVDNCVSVAS